MRHLMTVIVGLLAIVDILAGCVAWQPNIPGASAPMSTPPAAPMPAAPIVASIVPPLAQAARLNKIATRQVTALTVANLSGAKPVILRGLRTQRSALKAATSKATRAIPAAKASDLAVKRNAGQVTELQRKIRQMKQKQVQMVLTGGAIAGGLCVLAGIAVLVFMHGFAEGPVLILVGGGMIGLVWFAAAHIQWIEYASAASVVGLMFWMILGRHHEHVLRCAASCAPVKGVA